MEILGRFPCAWFAALSLGPRGDAIDPCLWCCSPAGPHEECDSKASGVHQELFPGVTVRLTQELRARGADGTAPLPCGGRGCAAP